MATPARTVPAGGAVAALLATVATLLATVAALLAARGRRGSPGIITVRRGPSVGIPGIREQPVALVNVEGVRRFPEVIGVRRRGHSGHQSERGFHLQG